MTYTEVCKMTRKKTAAAAAAVIMALSTAGCADSAPNENGSMGSALKKGRYVETVISPPEDIGAFYSGEFVNGSPISYYSPMCNTVYTNADGSFKAEKTSIDIDDTQYYISKMMRLPDGSGALSYIKAMSFGGADDTTSDENSSLPDMDTLLALISPDGSIKKVDIANVYDFELTEDGRLFAVISSDRINGTPLLCEIDTDTGKANVLNAALSYIYNIDISGRYIILSDVYSSDVIVYDYEANTLFTETDVLREFWGDVIVNDGDYTGMTEYDICDGGDDTIYIVCPKGLYRYELGGNMIEQLIDGSSCLIGMKDSNGAGVSYVTYEGDDSLLVQCADNTLVRYKYDPDAEDMVRSQLRIYALEESDALSAAINDFRRCDPSVDVITEIGMDNGKTYEDAMKELTTQIMSDTPPDIIILDGMDINNLTDKDLLRDLSEDIGDISPEGGMLESAALWNDRDGLRSVAGGFMIPALACDTGDMKDIHSLKDLADAAEKSLDKQNKSYAVDLENTSGATLTENLLKACGAQLTDDNGSIDTEKLRSFYESCKRIMDASDHLDTGYDEYQTSNLLISVLDKNTTSFSYHFAPVILSDYCYDINGLTSLSDFKDDIEIKYGIDDSAHSFIPTLNTAICSSSKNQEDAKAFIKSLLSETTQNTFVHGQLPVNRTSFERNFDDDESLIMWSTIMADDGTMVEYRWKYTSQEEEEQLMDYIGSMENAVVFDKKTTETICENGGKYLNGDMTLDEAVNAVDSYLSIRSRE